MAEQTDKPKRRKLRSVETVRERAERVAAENNKPKREAKAPGVISRFFGATGALPIWRPVKFIGRFIIPSYIRSSWRELRQVTWPSRKQSRQLTGAVVIFSIVFGLIVAAFDYGLDKLFKEVIVK